MDPQQPIEQPTEKAPVAKPVPTSWAGLVASNNGEGSQNVPPPAPVNVTQNSGHVTKQQALGNGKTQKGPFKGKKNGPGKQRIHREPRDGQRTNKNGNRRTRNDRNS